MPKTREKAKVVSIERKQLSADDVRKKKAACIEAYVAAGFPLFECIGKEPAPGTKGSRTKYNPELTPEDFPGNYGVAIPPDVLVIDADPRMYPMRRNGSIVRKDGKRYKRAFKIWDDCQAVKHLREGEFDNSLDRFLNDMGYGENVETYIVKSGNGGYHVHLKLQVTARTAHRLPEYPGLDFKRYGGYMVGPYSVHPDTNRYYKKMRGQVNDLLSVNSKMLETLEKERVHNDDEGIEEYVEDEGSIELVTKFLQMAEPAIQDDSGDPHTNKIAVHGHDWGISPKLMLDLMLEHWNPRCAPPWTEKDLLYKIKSAYRSARGALGNRNPAFHFKDLEFDEDDGEDDPLLEKEKRYYDRWNEEKGLPKENDLGNTMGYLATPNQDLYRIYQFNELTNRVEYKQPPPWHRYGDVPLFDNNEQKVLMSWLQTERHYVVNQKMVYDATVALTKILYPFHPIRDFLNMLDWDGVPRIDTLLIDYAGCEDTELTREISKNTMLAAVNRVMDPGCKYDQVLILEGPQGNKKGQFIDVLSKGFSASLSLNLKNEKLLIENMNGVWFVTLDEIDRYTSQYGEQQSNKDFLGRKSDRHRMPWEPQAQDYKRQGIFIGTTNFIGGQYLSDNTGNRRYWPVSTGKFRLKNLEKVVDQLWAEAFHRFQEKEQFWISSARMKELAKHEVLKRTMRDPWQDIVCDYLDIWEAQDDDDERTPLTPKTLMSALGLRINDRNNYARLQGIMHNQGYILKATSGKSSVFVREDDELLDGIW